MIPVFDPFRFASVSLDVLAAARGARCSVTARQRARLKVLASTMRDSSFYREHLAGLARHATARSAHGDPRGLDGAL